MIKKRILTGDRPTGPLHIGHYVGSLKNRLILQEDYEEFILIADIQALTDNFDDPTRIEKNILEVTKDYLSVGLNPERVNIVVQSQVPELAELTVYFMNLLTVAQLERNPTVKSEILQKGLTDKIPVGFFVYPVSQAADILAFKADLVPVGEDQVPMIEQSREIARRFNSLYGPVFVEPRELLSDSPRLCGIDGKEKMSKSLNNAINLSDSREAVEKKVMSMYTDPTKIRVSDPGHAENNPVFTYLRTFGTDSERVRELEQGYEKGGIGDVEVKKYLITVLNDFLDPIRERRLQYERDESLARDILRQGTKKAIDVVNETMREVRKAMSLIRFD